MDISNKIADCIIKTLLAHAGGEKVEEEEVRVSGKVFGSYLGPRTSR